MLAELIHIARYRIETNASTDMAKQKVLHQLWATNTKNLRKINQIRRDIEKDQLKVSNLIATRQIEIKRYEFEKQRLCHKNTTVLNRLMYAYADFFYAWLASDSDLDFLNFFISIIFRS